MSRIFTASALNIVRSASPADRALLRETIHPYAAPAARFTDPPRTAETAPSRPQKTAARSARTAVAMSCHRKTVRKGLMESEPDRAREAKPFDYSGGRSGASKNLAPQHW